MHWLIKIAFLILLLGIFGCSKQTPEERYAAALAQAKTTSQRTDDILLGLKFGMRPKAFFDHCTMLNQQEKILEGKGGRMAQFELKELENTGWLNFAPKFTEPDPLSGDSAVLYALNFTVTYNGWAPWSDKLNNLVLLKDMTRVFMDKYDGGFIAVPHEEVGRVVVQLKDNRRIAMWIEGQEKVNGQFLDLSLVPDAPLVIAEAPAAKRMQ